MAFALINRKWKKGDQIELELPMNASKLVGDPRIQNTHGKVVLMRGPIVYCVEEADNKDFFDGNGAVTILQDGLLSGFEKDLLGGVVTIKGKARSCLEP